MRPIPYCGLPPTPDILGWNFDPPLMVALVGIAGLYAAACRGPGAPTSWERGCFALGWLITAAALISPLCSLAVALFHARVGQHMLLTLVAAPLLVLGRPERAWLARIGGEASSQGLLAAAAAFAATLWFWHLPGPYDFTLARIPPLEGAAAARRRILRMGAGGEHRNGVSDDSPRGIADTGAASAVRGPCRNHVGLGTIGPGGSATWRIADVGAGGRRPHGVDGRRDRHLDRPVGLVRPRAPAAGLRLGRAASPDDAPRSMRGQHARRP
jgi:hypothetical protein